MKNGVFTRYILALLIFVGFSVNVYALDNIEFNGDGSFGPDDYNISVALDLNSTDPIQYELAYDSSSGNENKKQIITMADLNWKSYRFDNNTNDYTELSDDHNFTLNGNEIIFSSWKIKYLRELNASILNPVDMTIFTDTTATAYEFGFFQEGNSYSFYEMLRTNGTILNQEFYHTFDEILEYKIDNRYFMSAEDVNDVGLAFAAGSVGATSGTLVEWDGNNGTLTANAGTWEINATVEHGNVLLTRPNDTNRYPWRTAFKVEDGIVWQGEYNEFDQAGIFYQFNQAGHDQFMSFIDASIPKKIFAGHINLISIDGSVVPLPDNFKMQVRPYQDTWNESHIIDVNSSGDFNATLSVNNETDYNSTFPVMLFIDNDGDGSLNWGTNDTFILETERTLETLNFDLESVTFVGSIEMIDFDGSPIASPPENIKMQVRPDRDNWQNEMTFDINSTTMDFNATGIFEFGVFTSDDNVTVTIFQDTNLNNNWDGDSGEMGCDGRVADDVKIFEEYEMPTFVITENILPLPVIYQPAVELFGISFKSERNLVKVEDNNSVLQITAFDSDDWISTDISVKELNVIASLESNSTNKHVLFDIRMGTELIDEIGNGTYVDILLGATKDGLFAWIDNDRMDDNVTSILFPDFNVSHEHNYSIKWNDNDSIDFFVDSVHVFTSQLPVANYSYIRPRHNGMHVQGIGIVKISDVRYVNVIYPLIPPSCDGIVDDTADSDGDGIPDSVENQYSFLDPQRREDGGFDEDGDGLNNLEEYLLGLNFTTVNDILFLNHSQTTTLVFNSTQEEHNITITIDDVRGGDLNLSASVEPVDFLDINQTWGSGFLNQGEYSGELTLSVKLREAQSGDANVTILLQDTLGNQISSDFAVEGPTQSDGLNPAIIMYILN